MKNPHETNRRDFLKTSTALAAGATLPYWFSRQPAFGKPSPNERLVLGCIGTGSRWHADGPAAMAFADCVAVCDVDSDHRDEAYKIVKKTQPGDRKVAKLEDYRAILDNPDIDIVTIVTPDHWHTKIAIEAMKAGKDIYCEKPLTLTIEEGKQICEVARQTKRVFQVGTQQRSEMEQRFLKAIALARNGRLGDIQEVECVIGGGPQSGPIPAIDVPKRLNWEKWQGQTPLNDFRWKDAKEGTDPTRCHYEFRWWYEYSGGKMTDWGAHHVDIAQWLIQQNGPGQGPTKIEPLVAEHVVPLDENGNPTQADRYNTANKFHIRATFPNGVIMHIKSHGRGGILVTGSEGRIFVNRGSLEGKPVEDLEKNPLPEDAIAKVYGGEVPQGHPHMHNFINCVASREQPVSDVFSHHRALTTCHLSNIALRLGRTLVWDPNSQEIQNDPQARAMQSRQQRAGYEIHV